MLYKNIYLNFCYLIHPNGMVDYVYASAKHTYIGVPFNETSNFFIDHSLLHRNRILHLTKQQMKLFI